MKMLVANRKTLSILPFFGIIMLVCFILPTVPAFASDAFEVGTQIGGISHLRYVNNDSSETAINFGAVAGAPLYMTGLPTERLAIGPELNFATTSTANTSLTAIYFGGRAAYFLRGHAVSGPYAMGQIATVLLYFNSTSARGISFGGGLGYQWRIGPALVFRAEGLYRRISVEDGDANANNFALVFEIGARFGKRDNSAANSVSVPDNSDKEGTK